MAFYFALYSVSCINLEEHAAKRYQQIKDTENNIDIQKKSKNRSSVFQIFKKPSKKTKGGNSTKSKTNPKRLNIEDIIIGDFPPETYTQSPPVACSSIPKSDSVQQEPKIRRHSSSSGEKRVTFNKSKKVRRKKQKTPTKKVITLRRPRSVSENENFLVDDVFTGSNSYIGHQRRNACEFSNQDFDSFKKYPWNTIEDGSRRDDAEDQIMIENLASCGQKRDDVINMADHHFRNFNVSIAKLKKSVGQLVRQQKLRELIAHWTTLSHHDRNHNDPNHQSLAASTSSELSSENVKDIDLHESMRKTCQPVTDVVSSKEQIKRLTNNQSSRIRTLRRKMTSPLDKLTKFSSLSKFATILETSFDNDADDQKEITTAKPNVERISPILEKLLLKHARSSYRGQVLKNITRLYRKSPQNTQKSAQKSQPDTHGSSDRNDSLTNLYSRVFLVEINYPKDQRNQRIQSPRKKSVQTRTGRKASHPPDSIGCFRKNIDTISL